MKTTQQVIKDTYLPAKLVRSTIRQLAGKDSLQDIANHGIDGGFHGFVYYTDTVAFYKRNRKLIVAAIEEMADQLGEDPITMVENFNCLRVSSPDHYGSDYSQAQHKHDLHSEVIRTLYGRMREDDTQVANALAWFAGEEVARAFCE